MTILTMMRIRASVLQQTPRTIQQTHHHTRINTIAKTAKLFSTKISHNTITADGQWSLPTVIHKPKKSNEITNNTTILKDGETTFQPPPPPPLLLISGWTGVSSDWGAIPTMLASRTGRDVITYDPRGMGNSVLIQQQEQDASSSSNNLTLELMAADAISVMASSATTAAAINDSASPPNSEKLVFSVGGVSMGGMIAQIIAGFAHGHIPLPEFTNNPHTNNNNHHALDITSLALICTTPGGSPPKHPPKRNFFKSFSSWSDGDTNGKNHQCAESFFDALGHDFLQRPGRKKIQQKLIRSFVSSRNGFVHKGAGGMAAQLQAVRRFDATDILPLIGGESSSGSGSGGLPCVIVHGEKDSVIPPENALELKQLLGDRSTLAFIEDCDHLCWVTHGQELVTIWGDFLNETR